jgi:beta-galactosidase
MGKVYQTLPLYENLKTTGVYVFGKNYDIPGKSTEVNVESQVRNESAGDATASLSEIVVDADGNRARAVQRRHRKISPAARPRRSPPPARSPARIFGT